MVRGAIRAVTGQSLTLNNGEFASTGDSDDFKSDPCNLFSEVRPMISIESSEPDLADLLRPFLLKHDFADHPLMSVDAMAELVDELPEAASS
jgi:hypothetical protein